MSSQTRTSMVVVRTRSKRRFGAVSSSRGNEYLNCPWRLKEEVLAESFWNGLEIDGGVKEGVLFATGTGTFGGVADLHRPHGLDCWQDDFLGHRHSPRAGMTSLSSQHLNAVKSDLLPFVLPICLESGPSIGNVCLKIRISKCRVQLFVQVLINRSHKD